MQSEISQIVLTSIFLVFSLHDSRVTKSGDPLHLLVCQFFSFVSFLYGPLGRVSISLTGFL